MSARDVKYAVVTMCFVVEQDMPRPQEPCYVTIWPGSYVELETHGNKGIGASKIGYRWRKVRDPANALDLAGEALAVVLDAAGPQYKPGDYAKMSAWDRMRVHVCEHGHYPLECSKCVLLYVQPEEEANGD